LRKGIDDFPDDAEIRITLSNFTVQRFDLSTEDKIQQSDAILRRAHDQLGDSVPLRLATAMATRLLSDDEQAIDALQQLQLVNSAFTPRDLASLLSALAQFYVGRGRRELSIDASIEAATLFPTEISYPHAALGHIIGHLIENKGKI